MKTNQDFTKMAFKDYYNSLSEEDKTILRERILSESGMAYTTFYYKLRFESWKPLERTLINNIINSID